MLSQAVEPGHFCSASSDLALVGAVFVEVQELVRGSHDLTKLQDVLQSTRQRRKTSATKLLELPWLKTLGTPPFIMIIIIWYIILLEYFLARVILLYFNACNFGSLQTLCGCRIW